MRRLSIPFLFALLLLSGAANPAAVVDVCHNYRCKAHYEIQPNRADWSKVRDVFEPPAGTPAEERRQIQLAVGAMERVVARYSNAGDDRGENSYDPDTTGKMDCIDESTNTTTYLKQFVARGWLRFHDVEERVVRHPYLFDVHWTAVIRDRTTGEEYAVDSWYYDNGTPAVIQPLAAWKRKASFTPPPGVK